MPNFIGKTYRGKEYAEIFLKLQYLETTFSKNLVNVLDNVKGELILNSATATPVVKPYASRPTKSATDGITIKQYIVSPKQRMIYEEFSPVDLLKSRFEATMKAGASNLESSEFDSLEVALYQAEMAAAIVKGLWTGDAVQADGLLDKMDADVAAKKVVGAILNKSNIVESMMGLYDESNGALIESGEGLIYADRSLKKFVVGANTTAAFRDVFTVTGGDHYFQDMKIEYLPLGANRMFTARPKDLIVATDLASDFSSIQVDRVQANSEDTFLKMLYTMDTICIAPENVTLFNII